MCARLPRGAAVLLGAAALAVALAMEHLGMTAILGAALVGFSIPAGENTPWSAAVHTVSRTGRALAPAFFVVTGITVLTGAFSDVSWPLILVAVGLGCAGKLLGAVSQLTSPALAFRSGPHSGPGLCARQGGDSAVGHPNTDPHS
jgi:Kef-type K+ transport system membrane component KefB